MGLFDFMKKIPTINEIKGSFGEWLAKVYAKTFPGTLVLHDVLIDGFGDYTSQIDLLIIGNRGIYVVEMKMYSDAKIYGDVRYSQWYYYLGGKKYEIYSPLKQNEKHVKYLKTFLKDFGEIPCFSILTVICDDFKLNGSMDGKTVLCNSLPAMERAMHMIAEKQPIVWDDDRKKEIYTYIKEHQHEGRAARAEHKQQVIEYKTQRETLAAEKKCPYCKTDLILRNGKYGAFYGCSNYPRCKYTLKIKEN